MADITPVSFLVREHGFDLYATRTPDGQWELQGFAIEVIASFSQHGGPPLQSVRYGTPEAAQGAAVRVLDAGAAFAGAISALMPPPPADPAPDEGA